MVPKIRNHIKKMISFWPKAFNYALVKKSNYVVMA